MDGESRLACGSRPKAAGIRLTKSPLRPLHHLIPILLPRSLAPTSADQEFQGRPALAGEVGPDASNCYDE
eukprot:5660783-Pyramimonas_sp.AAC.1